MTEHPLLIVVLAAGKGVRMRSSLPKVLHAIAGRSMLGHVLATAQAAGAGRLALVVAPGMEAVRAEAAKVAPGIEVFEQATQAGTAHAVLAAAPAIERHRGDVIVLFADTPLVEPGTLRRLSETLHGGAQVAVLSFTAPDATGYGRLMLGADGRVEAIREERDATDAERRIGLCNAGAMGFRVPDLVALLGRIANRNAKNEYYLTDAVAVAASPRPRCPVGRMCARGGAGRQFARAAGRRRGHLPGPRQAPGHGAGGHAGGAGDRVAELRHHDRQRCDDRAQRVLRTWRGGGGRRPRPRQLPHGRCPYRQGRAHRPFARLRPGADIGEKAHVGNFVEVKNAQLDRGAKANHLAYSATAVGEGANVGAGTIFCNYDGFHKHRTTIGKGAFIGSDSCWSRR